MAYENYSEGLSRLIRVVLDMDQSRRSTSKFYYGKYVASTRVESISGFDWRSFSNSTSSGGDVGVTGVTVSYGASAFNF